MPKDIKIAWDTNLMEGDIGLTANAGDIDTDEGLETAVILSLFTDRRAKDDDDLPDPDSDDRRGWWGDQVSDIEGDQIGSRLWLLERSKTTTEVLSQAKQYIEEALQWMIDDGIAAKINIEVERQGTIGNERLAFKVEIMKTDGNNVALKFNEQWDGQFNL